MTTFLTDDRRVEIEASPDGEAVWVGSSQLETLTGYALKPEGACRADVCIPLPDALRRANEVDVAGFWRHIGHPVLNDSSGSVWHLAVNAMGRRSALESLQAPDFTLPDLRGTEHSLSDFRGKKVFLATWASW